MNQPIAINWAASLVLAVSFCSPMPGADLSGAARFREQVQPILATYCYSCHGDGDSEGNRTLDTFESDEAMLANVELWSAVLKNVRAGIMPPSGEARPSEGERRALFDWIKFDVFRIDPDNQDPGRVTLRRLNRVEYRNTIRDLMGVDYNTQELFPADDSGYGFDNIGDVLSVSPLLMEKYLEASEAIVREAVPTIARAPDEKRIGGRGFRSEDGAHNGDRLSYYAPSAVSRAFNAKHDGKYRVLVNVELDGSFEFDPARCNVMLLADGEPLHEEEYVWADRESRQIELEAEWTAGKRDLRFALQPLVPAEQRQNSMDFRIRSVVVQGPMEEEHWIEPRNYRRFFPRGAPSDVDASRNEYAREVIERFARLAYRRPADEEHVKALVELAKATYTQPGASFEQGISRALAAMLASPRFLFRMEDAADAPAEPRYPLVDEYALASRLSYFLWSTMPDAELMELAERSQLRANLPAQVARMVEDRRSAEFVKNFTGQWLRARDVEHAVVYPLAILGLQDDRDRVQKEFRELRRIERKRDDDQPDEEVEQNESEDERAEGEQAAKHERRERRKRIKELQAEIARFDEVAEMFTRDLRLAMRRETELLFEEVMREDRSLLDLIDSDYIYVNEVLAEHYGLEGVEGADLRRVELPADSSRGGILTQGTMLVVTSNPTRTSPVKRGLFILENVLGTPPPPPPAAVPPLEKSADAITDHEPTIRELQVLHRADPLCHSCHARMDPLGLALENFNALGMYRETENDRPIEPAGELLTGEAFDGIRQLKTIIKTERRLDFYRCVTEKLLTYALGRGLEYSDEHAIDEIVERLEADGGKFSTLLAGVVNSPQFQKMRLEETAAVSSHPP